MREEFLYLYPSDYNRHVTNFTGPICENSETTDHLADHRDKETGAPASPKLTGGGAADCNAPPEDPRVAKRRGSTDILDIKKMKTLFFDYPSTGSLDASSSSKRCLTSTRTGENESVLASESTNKNGCHSVETGRRYQLRFNVAGFEPSAIRVTTDGVRIIVRAAKAERREIHKAETGCREITDGEDTLPCVVEREYYRKIQKPKEVDHAKLRAYLTADMILVVEAPISSLDRVTGGAGSQTDRSAVKTGRMSHSASHSSHGSTASRASSHGSTPKSPASNSPGTPGGGAKEKIGVPIFRDENGTRKMHLTIDLGAAYEADDIIVQVSVVD